MKIFAWIFGVVIALVLGAVLFVFSGMGENLIKNYASKTIKEKSGFEVKFDKFNLNFGDFDINATINSDILASAKGKYWLLSKEVLADYNVSAKTLKNFGINSDENLNLNGKILLKNDKISANGVGEAFDSSVRFLVDLLGANPQNIQINAKNLNIAKVLAVANKPKILSGNIDIISNINADEKGGTATIKSTNLTLNKGAIKGYDKDIAMSLNSEIMLKNNLITAISQIASKPLKIETQNSIYDIKNKTLKSDFDIFVPNLAEFEKLIGQKITTAINANGDIETNFDKIALKNAKIKAFKNALIGDINADYELKNASGKMNADIDISDFASLKELTKTALQGKANAKINANIVKNTLGKFDAKINALGGNMSAKGDLKNISVEANSLEIGVLSGFAGFGGLGEGKANLKGDFTLGDKINGNAQFSVKNGVLYKGFLDKMTNKNFPNNVKFSLNSDKISIKNSLASFGISFSSDLVDFDKFNGTYDLNTAFLKADYSMKIANLSKLDFLTGIRLVGAFGGNGELNKKGQNLSATLVSNTLGGTLNAKYQNQNFTANLKNFVIKELLKMLDMSHFYDGAGSLDLSYNVANKKGKFDANIDNGRLVNNGFLGVVSKVINRDLSSEVYKNGKVNGTINKNLISFNANLSAQKSQISVQNGTLNTANNAINVPVKANVEKTDIAVDITGTTKAPKYSVSSDYLKQKISDKIEKKLDKYLDKKGKSDETDPTKDAIKGLIKGLF